MVPPFIKYQVMAFMIAWFSATLTQQVAGNPSSFPTRYTDLRNFYRSFRNKMPNRGTRIYKSFNISDLEGILNDWEDVTLEMMNAKNYTDCPTELPERLNSSGYVIGTFSDDETENIYCILSSILDYSAVDEASPLGIFITNPASTNCLITTSAHPRNDFYSGDQALSVFRGTDAKAFTTSGAHRDSGFGNSTCQPTYGAADPAHTTLNGLQAATHAIKRYYEENPCDYTVIQFHGMGSSTCSGIDAHLTNGGNQFIPREGEKLELLRGCLTDNLPPESVFTIPGDEPLCPLAGRVNIQGRLLNDVEEEDICFKSARQHTSHFVHFEQKRWLRDPAVFPAYTEAFNCFIDKVKDAIPPLPPPFCNITNISGGDTWELGSKVTVTWDSSGITKDLKVSVVVADSYQYADTLGDHIPAEIGSASFQLRGTVDEGFLDRLLRLRDNGDTSIKCYSQQPVTIKNPFEFVYSESQKMTKRTRFLILWSPRPEICPKVKISWHKKERNGYYRTISHSADNNGQIEYYVSSTFVPGFYSIRIRCTSDPYIYHFSYNNSPESNHSSDFMEILG